MTIVGVAGAIPRVLSGTNKISSFWLVEENVACKSARGENMRAKEIKVRNVSERLEMSRTYRSLSSVELPQQTNFSNEPLRRDWT